MVEVVQVAPHRIHKCIECRATLKYHYKDVDRTLLQGSHGGCWRSSIECPECSTTNYVQHWQEDDKVESKD